MAENKKEKTGWIERITFKQSVIITLVYFVALFSCIVYTDGVIKPCTDTITSVHSGTNGRNAHINYWLKDRNHSIARTVPVIIWSVTGRVELHRLGVPHNADNLHVEVSYFATNLSLANGHVGLRLGKDNYPKDFWYYWTLYGAVSQNILFLIATVLFCAIGVFCKRNGVVGAKVTIYRIFCALYAVFWAVVL